MPLTYVFNINFLKRITFRWDSNNVNTIGCPAPQVKVRVKVKVKKPVIGADAEIGPNNRSPVSKEYDRFVKWCFRQVMHCGCHFEF